MLWPCRDLTLSPSASVSPERIISFRAFLPCPWSCSKPSYFIVNFGGQLFGYHPFGDQLITLTSDRQTRLGTNLKLDSWQNSHINLNPQNFINACIEDMIEYINTGSLCLVYSRRESNSIYTDKERAHLYGERQINSKTNTVVSPNLSPNRMCTVL